MQRTLFSQGLQTNVIRDAMLKLLTSMVIDSHQVLKSRFADIVIKVQSCHSFVAKVAALKNNPPPLPPYVDLLDLSSEVLSSSVP